MEVKCIRTLREFYKSNIKQTADANRLCHFAGREMQLDGETSLGFFEMFNGEGEIDNKLATILGMAGDSQAIYEFMQNAVDADSKHFMLSLYRHEGRPYLIVLNDGEYFSLRSVISILAIGDSSKFRNPDNIGQFGVGFKLAHRLIGADNSIRELLDENKGPILYSWANGEFATLGSAGVVTITDPQFSGVRKDAISASNAPWLFKMVATNFPCLIEDEVWDARGRQHSGLFTEEEYDALRGAATQCYKEFTDCASFQKGTMLLIPLHEGKIKAVIGEVPKGLEIAATIIGKRAGKEHVLTTIIKKEYLKPAALDVELWKLAPEETAGRLGNEPIDKAELMLLFGDPFTGNPFEGKPQFYRYFPMALEQHGLRFAVHGNALSFSSARTELQESEPNKFLFGKLAEGLDTRLRDYAESDSERFRNLYASILLSDRSVGGGGWKEGRGWLEEALWQPLMDVLAGQIPVKGDGGMAISACGESVLIKSSSLPIAAWHGGDAASWFYWDTSESRHGEVCNAAAAKLGLKRIGLLDVLVTSEATDAVNRWLGTSPEHAQLFLSELNSASFEAYDRAAVWKTFGGLKLWWFGEQVYSITQLASQPELACFLINYGPLAEVAKELEKAGVHLSQHSLDNYSAIERTVREISFSSLPYLFNYEELNRLLSGPFTKTDALAPADKQIIFKAIERAVRDSANSVVRRIATMKPLAIFKNKVGAVLPLHQLIGTTDVPSMLSGWRISEGETQGLNLTEYLSSSREEIYELVALPHWEEIMAQKATQEERMKLFSWLAGSYALKSTMPLPNSTRVFFGHDGSREAAFYHQSLQGLQPAEYRLLSKACSALGIGNLPHYSLLRFYAEPPFSLKPAEGITVSDEHTPLSKAEITTFIRWAKNAFPDVGHRSLFSEDEEGTFTISIRPEGVHHFSSPTEEIRAYAEDFLEDKLVPLPAALTSVMGDDVLHGERLLERFIHELPNNTEGIWELIQLIQDNGADSLKQTLFDQMSPIELTTPLDVNSLQYQVLHLCFSISNDEQRRASLEKLAGITIGDGRTPLSDITNRGSDRIIVPHPVAGEITLSVSELLHGDSANINHILTDAALRWEAAGLATREKIEDALGIHDAPPVDGVYEQMLSTLEDGKLQNGAQLLFAMLMRDARDWAVSLQVETIAGWRDFSGNFYLRADSIIPPELTLHERYSSAVAPYLTTAPKIESEEISLLGNPYFDGSDFVLPGIDAVPEEAQPAFWAALAESWQGTGTPSAITINGNNDLEPWLGMSPAMWVLNEEYALEEELAPRSTLHEYGIDEVDVDGLLLALGAHGPDSSLVQTRQYFQSDVGRVDNLLPAPLIVNTLQWLMEKGIVVRNEDLASFYKTLSQKVSELGLFPGYVPGRHGLTIVGLGDDVFFVSKDTIQAILQKRYSPQQVAETAKATIVASIGALYDWQQPLRNTLKELPIRWHESDWEAAEAEAAEWAAPFYKTWKAVHSHFELRMLRGEMPRVSLVNGNPLARYRDGKVAISQDKNVVYVAGGFSTETILDCLDNEGVFTESARSALRTAYTAQSETFQKYISLAEKDPQFAEIIQKSAETALLKEDLKRISLQVQQRDNFYTLEWLQNLLNLVRVQERSAAIPELTFSRCERLPAAEKVYELSDYNGRIPSSIGSFEEIPASIRYRADDGSIVQFSTKIEASQKHQKVWARFPEARAQEILQKPIVSVTLSFTRTVDLIEELRRGYERLQMRPADNLKNTLSPNIDFLFGPPGTGKTTTLATDIIGRIESGKGGPIVVLTPTNKAADVLARKIIEQSGGTDAPRWLIRAGTCTEPDLLASGAVRPLAELIVSAGSQTVLITTIHRFPYFTVYANAHSAEKVRLCDCPWAEVIFDEASMIPLAYIVYAIQARQRADSTTHFLVAGDPLQIPPVFDLIADDLDEAEELERHNIYSMIGLNSFDEAVQGEIPTWGSRIQNLTTQHRSIPAIGELYSKFQYGARILHSRGTADNKKPGTSRPLPKRFAALGFKPITVIRYPVLSGDSIYEPRKLKGSPIHLYTSLLVSELVKAFRAGVVQEGQKAWSVGVLSPYRSQADVLEKMIEGHPQQSSEVSVTTDTVHGFQGDENGMVFTVFNPSTVNVGIGRFLNKEFILNVAISRAEDYLVMLIPDDESKGIHNLTLLQELMGQVKALPKDMYAFINATELEAKLMGTPQYFERNSFSSAHQKVNVYGLPQMPYMIRLGEESVDVHWKE